MGVASRPYMIDVVVKRSSSLSQLLMSSCLLTLCGLTSQKRCENPPGRHIGLGGSVHEKSASLFPIFYANTPQTH